MFRIKEELENGEVSDYDIREKGTLRYKKRICVPDNEVIKKTILEKAHRSKYTIHLGNTKMYRNLKQGFFVV